MVQNKLNNNQIKEILEEYYDIEAVKITEIDRGTADIFKIESDNKKYILKQFIEGRSKDLIEKEIDIINFLEEKNIRVPIYIKTKKGVFYIEIKNRVIIVQEYIDGYIIKDNCADYQKTIECAGIFGKLVQVLQEYKELSDDGIMKKSFSQEGLKAGIKRIKDFEDQIKLDNKYKEIFYKDMEYKINIAENLLETFDFNIINNTTICNTHGDYSMQQLIFNDEKGTTIIDFERAKRMPIVWELMRSYTYIDEKVKDGVIELETLIDYFKEFSKYVQLNEYDLKYAAYIYLMQLVTSIFGYKEYNDNYQNTELLKFGFFRTKVCKYLYDNLDEIGNKLSDIAEG